VLKDKLKQLMAINFLEPKDEWINMLAFGEIIKDILYEDKNKCGGGEGKGKGGGGEGKGKGDGKGEVQGPVFGDISIDDFSDNQINEGLNEIIRKYGIERYKMIKKFLEEKTGRKWDKDTEKSSGKLAGIGSVDEIERNDDMIPYYERLSKTYGMYIIKKPVLVDVIDNYPYENIEFSPGDPLNRLNKFSTGGRILPGITKRHKEGCGKKQDRTFKVPHCFICIDSSGSMTHPRNKSHAVNTGFVIARNYYANNAKIAVMNFSADSFLLLPTRELHDVYAALCAYWGGGTVLDTEKMKEYITKYFGKEFYSGKKSANYIVSDEKDYEELIGRLGKRERKEFEKKASIEVKLKEVKEVFDKVDMHMITDGEIANLPEVIEYFNSISKMTRSTIYLIENPNQYAEWQSLNLPNTQIINVENEKDLEHICIGKVKKNLVPENPTPKNLFYR